jgi:hypothetical protein
MRQETDRTAYILTYSEFAKHLGLVDSEQITGIVHDLVLRQVKILTYNPSGQYTVPEGAEPPLERLPSQSDW